jgi:hypothetical protein
MANKTTNMHLAIKLFLFGFCGGAALSQFVRNLHGGGQNEPGANKPHRYVT